MDNGITIKNGKTEITMNEQEISVSVPGVFVTVMMDGESTSATTVTKEQIQAQVADNQMKRLGKPSFNC